MNVLARLFPDKYEVYCMAQRYDTIGGKFEIMHLDNELTKSEPPHIHICVKKGTKGFRGKNLKNGSPFMSVFKVKLNPNCNEKYTRDNIVLIEDYGNNFNEVKDDLIEWLNAKDEDGKPNCRDCLKNYLRSNGFGSFRNEYEKEALKIMNPHQIKDF